MSKKKSKDHPGCVGVSEVHDNGAEVRVTCTHCRMTLTYDAEYFRQNLHELLHDEGAPDDNNPA